MTLLKKIRHSLSLRLLLLFVATGIVLGIVFQVMIGYAISTHLMEKGAPHLKQYFSYIQRDLGSPLSIERAKDVAARLPIDIQINDGQQSWASSPDTPAITDLYPYTDNTLPQQTVNIKFKRGQTIVQIIEGDAEAILWTNPRKERNPPGRGLLVGLSILTIILATLYWLIRRLFRPIQTIKQSVQRIGSGDLKQRIPPLRDDELGELAGSINHMADDIEQMLEAKRELLLAISHELRSPLTRAKVSTALLEDSPTQANIARDLREMENMISELLEAERLNGQHQQLQKVDVSLNEIVMSVIDEYFPDAEFDIELQDDLPAQPLDPVRMRLVARNILDNALKHQQPDSKPVLVITQASADSNQFSIQDFGRGIPKDHIPHLTDAFYRVDASRQRKTGGVGLGLYLVKRIIDAHHGTLEITSEEGAGTTVNITLPYKANN